jgi:hypothetical protein
MTNPRKFIKLACLFTYFRKIKFEKNVHRIDWIYGLDQGYGLIVERDEIIYEDTRWLISFVYLDFHGKVFEKLDTIEHHCKFVYVKVNNEEPTEFVLNLSTIEEEISVQICRINKTEIVAGELIRLDFDCICYSGECIYDVNWIENEDGLQTVSLIFSPFNM